MFVFVWFPSFLIDSAVVVVVVKLRVNLGRLLAHATLDPEADLRDEEEKAHDHPAHRHHHLHFVGQSQKHAKLFRHHLKTKFLIF